MRRRFGDDILPVAVVAALTYGVIFVVRPLAVGDTNNRPAVVALIFLSAPSLVVK